MIPCLILAVIWILYQVKKNFYRDQLTTRKGRLSEQLDEEHIIELDIL